MRVISVAGRTRRRAGSRWGRHAHALSLVTLVWGSRAGGLDVPTEADRLVEGYAQADLRRVLLSGAALTGSSLTHWGRLHGYAEPEDWLRATARSVALGA